MRKAFYAFVVLGLIGLGAFAYFTHPEAADAAALAGVTPEAERGRMVFLAGGCASCHAAEGAKGADKLVLSGGRSFPSPFGTFHAPNISPHPEAGIGGWEVIDLLNAMWHGVSPEGAHYFPAFPYTSYTRVAAEDVANLHAYLMTLPASDVPSRAHDVGFPFNIRRTLGGWKLLYLDDAWVVDGDLSPQALRGRYLAEGLGHCGECHTPRDALGGLIKSRWLAGAPNPTGKGRIPNITPAALTWSESDIAAYLETGFTPEFDSAGGHMAEVIENYSQLPPEDRAAVAAYLKAVPPVADQN